MREIITKDTRKSFKKLYKREASYVIYPQGRKEGITLIKFGESFYG